MVRWTDKRTLLMLTTKHTNAMVDVQPRYRESKLREYVHTYIHTHMVRTYVGHIRICVYEYLRGHIINIQPTYEVTTTPNVMKYIAEKRYIQSCTRALAGPRFRVSDPQISARSSKNRAQGVQWTPAFLWRNARRR